MGFSTKKTIQRFWDSSMAGNHWGGSPGRWLPSLLVELWWQVRCVTFRKLQHVEMERLSWIWFDLILKHQQLLVGWRWNPKFDILEVLRRMQWECDFRPRDRRFDALEQPQQVKHDMKLMNIPRRSAQLQIFTRVLGVLPHVTGVCLGLYHLTGV